MECTWYIPPSAKVMWSIVGVLCSDQVLGYLPHKNIVLYCMYIYYWYQAHSSLIKCFTYMVTQHFMLCAYIKPQWQRVHPYLSFIGRIHAVYGPIYGSCICPYREHKSTVLLFVIVHFKLFWIYKEWKITVHIHGLLYHCLQKIKLTIKSFKLDDTETCYKNQLIIYDGEIADDTIRQEYCRYTDIKTIENHAFSAKKGIGFRFWSRSRTTEDKKKMKTISFKICYHVGEYSIYNSLNVIRNDVILNHRWLLP